MTEILDGAQLRLHSDYLKRLGRLSPASSALNLLDLLQLLNFHIIKATRWLFLLSEKLVVTDIDRVIGLS